MYQIFANYSVLLLKLDRYNTSFLLTTSNIPFEVQEGRMPWIAITRDPVLKKKNLPLFFVRIFGQQTEKANTIFKQTTFSQCLHCWSKSRCETAFFVINPAGFALPTQLAMKLLESTSMVVRNRNTFQVDKNGLNTYKQKMDKVAEPWINFILQAHQCFNPSATAVPYNKYVFNLHNHMAYILLMFPEKGQRVSAKL